MSFSRAVVFKLFWAVYIVANLVVFFERFYVYRWGGKREWFDAIGYGVVVSRACGAGLKLNLAVIVLPMLRILMSWLSSTPFGFYFPVENNLFFHKVVAFVVLILMTGHSWFHFLNIYEIARLDVDVGHALGLCRQDDSMIQPWQFLYGTVPGVTGMILVILMILIYATASGNVKDSSFEHFWYVHHLFLVVFVVLCIHGASAMLEPPTVEIWLLGPTILYITEKITRFSKGNQSIKILKIKGHSGNVIEIRVQKSHTFMFLPGQYAYLSCPFISKYQWHPFTISSSPHEHYLTFHIKSKGNWTEKLMELLNPESILGTIARNVTSDPNGNRLLKMDGPYGSPAQQVFDYKSVLIFACGIGITPYVSFLKYLSYMKQNHVPTKIEDVKLIWVSRTIESFEWPLDTLNMTVDNFDDFQMRLYLSSLRKDKKYWQKRDGYNITYNGGRPDPQVLLSKYSFRSRKVGVFFCGPQTFSSAIKTACADTVGYHKFIYHKEIF